MATDDQTALESFDKAPIPDDACIRYDDCGETVPGRATMCSNCLDEARKRDREADYDTYYQRLTEQSTEYRPGDSDSEIHTP